MSEDVDVEAIALQLDGFTGADIENICREVLS
jgi:SpoVK/Ycf46/Vps4 family AAA+-type ATPase